jgi:hypothetical protein
MKVTAANMNEAAARAVVDQIKSAGGTKRRRMDIGLLLSHRGNGESS